jgi:hypothetical protein
MATAMRGTQGYPSSEGVACLRAAEPRTNGACGYF